MERSTKGKGWTAMAKVGVALGAGLVVLVLLFVVSRVDTLPVQCLSVFGFGVPCDSGWAPAAAAATTAFVGLLLWLKGRPSSSPSDIAAP